MVQKRVAKGTNTTHPNVSFSDMSMSAKNYSKYYFQGRVISHNNQIFQHGGGSGIERRRHVAVGDPEVNSVGQDSGLLPSSCPAVDSTVYEIKQRREHQR